MIHPPESLSGCSSVLVNLARSLLLSMSSNGMNWSSSLALGLMERRTDFSGPPAVELLLVLNFDPLLLEVPLLEVFLLDANVDVILGQNLAINIRCAGMHPQTIETSISIRLHRPAST